MGYFIQLLAKCSELGLGIPNLIGLTHTRTDTHACTHTHSVSLPLNNSQAPISAPMQSQKGVQKQESDNKKHFYLQPLERNMKKTEHKILMMRSSAQKEFYIKTVIYICIYIKKERFFWSTAESQG